MKMYLPIGDWSHDGHGEYERYLIDAPSMEHVIQAQKALTEDFGDFWSDFCMGYERGLGPAVLKVLVEMGCPIDFFAEIVDDNRVDEFEDLEDYFESVNWREHYIGPHECAKLLVWMLNQEHAHIKMFDAEDTIPMLCSHGFTTVGYVVLNKISKEEGI